jgi:phosphoglucosamine mutase
MTLRFGTDGVRGFAEELTDDLVFALGRAAARTLGASTFVVGRDTRESGPRLRDALVAGLSSEGVAVADLGVVPTPAVAHAAAEGGAVISASHNPYVDNGVKFFAAGGRKLRDDEEARLEAELDRLVGEVHAPARTTSVTEASPAGYEGHLVASIDGRRLDGVRVVLDCANGAASTVGPDVLRALGVDLTVIHAEPDGRNINERCGATDPSSLQRAVVGNAHAGLALDGDADRVIAVNDRGEIVDGDHILAIAAADLLQRGRLRDDTVVVTVMSNLGFRQAMERIGVTVHETPVGDRSVLEALDEHGWSLGGEQSGHVIFRDIASTGDGLLTGIQLLDVVRRTGRSLHELASFVTSLPQVMLNVRVSVRDPDIAQRIAADIAAAEARLGSGGRVLVRPSGTEPLVRVMVEAATRAEAEAVADDLAAAVAAAEHPA